MKILLADDHALFRDGLRLILDKFDPSIEVIEAASFDQALETAREHTDLALMILDLKMPGMAGAQSVATVRHAFPDIPVVVLSGAYARTDVAAALDCGAAGFIPKTLGGRALFGAINIVLAGEKYVPSEIYFDNSQSLSDGADQSVADVFTTLTPRERDVLGLLVDGFSNRQIAEKLKIQEVSVRARLTAVFRKIGVKNRTQAVAAAIRGGFSS